MKVIGCLDEPLITPTEKERDGYVPNVAYSCGAMIHNGQLYLPFATSDMITRFAIVSLDSLLEPADRLKLRDFLMAVNRCVRDWNDYTGWQRAKSQTRRHP